MDYHSGSKKNGKQINFQFFTANVTGKMEYEKCFHCQCGNEDEGRTN